ncbi:MAG: ABC transporter ATP-binding protein [Desulfobacterales bacterium]|nr:ABC transporter ATP-binding protein [Desulfobacterales bacterium]MCU0603343.1 ABC transporter ATP-binding protein [Desulfobacterales bacterium]
MLEVRRMDVAYGHARVLHDVELRLSPGEMVFIVGRNGAGKTTLLKTIAGLLKPLQGEIRFNDRPVAGLKPEALARSGFRFVAQDKRVFSSLSVRSNIELAAHGAGEPVEEAWRKAVEIYPKLDEFRALPAGRLSGGQREILLIGRALVGNPRVLLIDEPTEGLAAVVIEDIFRILQRMRQTVASIIVEQNLSIVRRLADRIYVMKEGRVVREIADKKEIADSAQLECYL